MKFELEVYNRNSSDTELLDDLRRVAIELQQDKVTTEQYDERGKFSSSTLIRRFETWLKTLEKAGLKKTKNHNITDEELFQNIEEVWLTLGRQPRSAEMIRPTSKFGTTTYLNRFGTWLKALERFVEFINTDELETLNTIIDKPEISQRHKTKRDINWRLRFLIMRRDNFKCCACGNSPVTKPEIILHVDHILSWSQGGETVYENLQTLCRTCNIGKSNLPYYEE